MIKQQMKLNTCHSIATRRGVTTMEVVVFVGLITVGMLTAFQTFGPSTASSFKEIAMELEEESNQTGSRTQLSEHGQLLANQVMALKKKTSIASEICLACLIVGGGLYFRLFRKRKMELRIKEEEVAAIQKQSLALQKILSKRNSILNCIDENLESILHGHALVGTYMSTGVVSIEPETPKSEALILMREQGFRRFIVKRSNGDLAGVVSRKDILSKAGERVSDVMTTQPKITTPNTEIHTALSILLENRISCLPVVEDGKFVGLLSVSDLLMVLQCLLRDLVDRNTNTEFKNTNETVAAQPV